YDLDKLQKPAAVIRDRQTFIAGWCVLLLLLTGFFVLEPLGVPVSLVATVAAGILWLVARRGQIIDTTKVVRDAPWQIVVFSLGMYLVVYGLRNAGLTGYLTQLLNAFAAQG
ncbi:ArsB/NhaD family transporter, partial [Dickeya dianthicola]